MIDYLHKGLARAVKAGGIIALLLLGTFPVLQAATAREKPLMRNFMGIDGHISFKPELYAQVAHLARNYHAVTWDNLGDMSYPPKFPFTREAVSNHGAPALVDWSKVYGSWKAQGFAVDASLQVEGIKQEKWNKDKDVEKNAFMYGEAFAKCLGPSHENEVDAAEISGDSSKFDDALFRKIFANMAKGMRAGDPKLLIVTPTVAIKAYDHSRSADSLKGLDYDVLSMHVFATTTDGPVTINPKNAPLFPEYGGANIQPVKEMIAWRNANAPGKKLWITEFGYNTPAQPPGTDPRGSSVNETEQAQWLARSFLVYSSMDVDQAYVFYFNDETQTGAYDWWGITHNYQPKPSFYALAHMQKTFG